ncbi:hypothetical protein CWO91_19590 [Bradyrhizobium genosp. SA-3]|uniref:hypothetical protein n=1 Tax=Bradyrhizobium genosp. SA-3 TaxID=508868 RepID=UPI001028BCF8|nr:hypothetical protein [Bradyrhizobium genosp. SA-3]RZN09017.1 hypothetical protein CWO91_19590 [Bradyrhizobium genosp. SA-3]
MTYTTSLGSWVYTLQPDGSITANGGIARAVRIGRAPAATAKSSQTGPNEGAVVGNQNLKPVKPMKDCSGVSGKINGVELKPMKCDDAPPKTVAAAPAQIPPPAKQPSSGAVAGSKGALEAVAEISPEFKKALDNAALKLEHAKIDPTRLKEPVTHTSEPAPTRTEAKASPSETTSAPVAADEPRAPPRAITELDPDDYAKTCRDESFASGLKSLKQDIAAATEDVVRQRDPKNTRPVRGLKFYAEKYKLIKKVLKVCALEVFKKQIVEPIEMSDIFDDPSYDAR